MAILTVKDASQVYTPAAMEVPAGGGDSFPNDGKTVLIIRGATGNSVTVLADSPGTCNFGAAANAAHDVSLVVGTALFAIMGPFDPGKFNDTNGRVQVTYTGTLTGAGVIAARLVS